METTSKKTKCDRKKEMIRILRIWPKITGIEAEWMVDDLEESLNIFWLSITDITDLAIKECS